MNRAAWNWCGHGVGVGVGSGRGEEEERGCCGGDEEEEEEDGRMELRGRHRVAWTAGFDGEREGRREMSFRLH